LVPRVQPVRVSREVLTTDTLLCGAVRSEEREGFYMSYGAHTISVRGKQIQLLRGGSGPPLLYFHDTFCYTWMPAHDRLAAHYEVIVPLHPGCEGSDGFETIDTMEDLVFHYLDVCEALGIQRPVLLGTSLGGWLAAEFAIRYADRLRALILVDAFGLRIPQAPAADLFRLDAAQLRATLFASPTAPVAHAVVPDTPAPEAMLAFLQARQVLARFAWQFPDNSKLIHYLYRVHVPTLILWGEQDAVISLAHGRAYQAGIANAALHVLPQCGHLPHAEQSEAFTHALLTYLARLEG
jgi:pimeloyl-ACP methyl ester carboxylesterase